MIVGILVGRRQQEVAQVADGVVLDVVHVAQRAQRVGRQGLVPEVIEVDALQVQAPRPVLVGIDGGSHSAYYSEPRLRPDGRNSRHPRWRAGPNRSDMPTYRRSERCPAGDLHRPLQRGGTGRGLPAPRRGRLRLGQAGAQQPDRGRGRDPGGLPAAVEPARPLRPRPGLPALLPARPGPRPGRRRRPLVELAAPARGPRRPAHGRRRRYDMQREVWDLAVADQVSQAMGELPEEERRAIELAYFDGRTYREVAQLLDQPEGTVKSRIRNGMRRMRAVLADAGVQGGRRVMSHDEASDLLGAYALDAVDGDEFTELEEHLETCPRCRAELDSLREVAAAMGNSVEPLPEGLWSQIASRLPERQEDDEPPPMPQLARRGRAHRSAPPADGRTPPAPRTVSPPSAPSRWPPPPWPSCSASDWCGPTTRSRNLQSAQRTPAVDGDGRAAHARAPGRHPRREHPRRELAAGRGRALRAGLPGLVERCRASATARRTSCGRSRGTSRSPSACSGGSPRQAAFTMAGSTRPSHLSITAEPAGGSVFPTGSDHRHRDCLTPPPSC